MKSVYIPVVSEVREFFSEEGWLMKIGAGLVLLIVLSVVLLVGFRLVCVDFVENYQLGYVYDARDGTITRLGRTGYIVTWPFVQSVHTVDLRPMQVRISANSRVLNAKLVQFNPDEVDPDTGMRGLELFLSWHGRGNYDGPNVSGSSFASSTPFSDILTSYAYEGSGKSYPFLTIIRELKTEEVDKALVQTTSGAKP